MGLTPPHLGWSRGCGNGIGYSGHKNEYISGVAINNFREDRAGLELQKSSANAFGWQRPEQLTTCYRKAHSRTAEEYARALQGRFAEIPRDFLKECKHSQDKGKKAIMEQEDPAGEEAPDPYTTVSSIAFALPSIGKSRLQTELWSGDKSNDLGITLREKAKKSLGTCVPRTAAPGSLLAEKAREWEEDSIPERRSKYSTTTASSSAQVATRAVMAAAEATSDGRSAAPASSKADVAARAQAAGAQAPMVGRKATGEFVDAADLKQKMYQKLHFRHPVLHTVKWLTPTEMDAAAAAQSAAGLVPPAAHTPSCNADPTGAAPGNFQEHADAASVVA